MIQVALKNSVGVVYFASSIPMNVLFVEDGAMGEWARKTWDAMRIGDTYEVWERAGVGSYWGRGNMRHV